MPTPANPRSQNRTVIAHVAANYALEPPIACRWIHRGYNDHYRIEAGESRYVFRIYLRGKYYIQSDDDFRFELDLLHTLAAGGVSVAAPIERQDGGLIGAIGGRAAALFEWANGDPIVGSIGNPSSELGAMVGRMHHLADQVARDSPFSRYHLDLRYLLDEPLRLTHDLFTRLGREEETALLAPVADLFRSQVQSIPQRPPHYGIIHADLHGENIHYDGHFTFLDFDHCAYGYRVHDLVTLREMMSDDAWDGFIAAYREQYDLDDADLQLLPLFRLLREVWGIGDDLAIRPVWDEEATEEDVDRVAETLRWVADEAPSV